MEQPKELGIAVLVVRLDEQQPSNLQEPIVEYREKEKELTIPVGRLSAGLSRSEKYRQRCRRLPRAQSLTAPAWFLLGISNTGWIVVRIFFVSLISPSSFLFGGQPTNGIERLVGRRRVTWSPVFGSSSMSPGSSTTVVFALLPAKSDWLWCTHQSLRPIFFLLSICLFLSLFCQRFSFDQYQVETILSRLLGSARSQSLSFSLFIFTLDNMACLSIYFISTRWKRRASSGNIHWHGRLRKRWKKRSSFSPFKMIKMTLPFLQFS